MILYSRRPARATWQIVADVFVVVWTIVWIWAGRATHDLVSRLAEPARALQSAGLSYEQRLGEIGAQLTDLPVIGSSLRDAFSAASTPGADVGASAADLAATVDRLAFTLGLSTALVPICAVVLPWLVVRGLFVRRAAATSELIRSGAATSLVALQALAQQPVRELLAIDPDPAAAWRRGDELVVARLAELQLRDSGVRLPSRVGQGA
ncbi:MAG: hypothetical protein Q4G51_06370 [Dermatophilus congolensis]|nr:hypothetical protein [Dermatophilus congolensis]